MSDVPTALAANRAAVRDFMAAAEQAGSRWSVARAPGKWSPAQLVEHVARSYEQSAHVVAGAPSQFPTLPGMLRPVVRGLFFNRILRKGTFPRAKTTKPFDPESGPASLADGRTRLDGAVGQFERACQARAGDGATMSSTLFGTVRVSDYVRFQELHTRHHQQQMLAGA